MDTTVVHPEPIVRYVDTDVLFQKSFRGLFPTSEPSVPGAFMMDSSNSFAAHPGDFWPLGPLRLPRQLNSGLFWIRRDSLDYERMEYLFKRWGPERIRRYHGWFEQTVWADQAWRAHCSMFDPAQFGTASQDGNLNSRLIGVHYVTPARNLLKAALESAPAALADNAQGSIEDIRMCAPMSFGIFGAVSVTARSLASRRPAG
jgi:hypothetical protein